MHDTLSAVSTEEKRKSVKANKDEEVDGGIEVLIGGNIISHDGLSPLSNNFSPPVNDKSSVGDITDHDVLSAITDHISPPVDGKNAASKVGWDFLNMVRFSGTLFSPYGV